MKKIFLLTLLTVGLLIGRSEAATILVIGDSLSAAYGMPIDQGWVALLQERLKEESLPHKVVNASISGDTSANARIRLGRAVDQHGPEIVLLEIGGNDGLRGLSLPQLRQNLAGMIESLLAQNIGIVLIGVQLPPNYGPRYTRSFSQVYQELAQQHNITLVPSLVDGIGTEPGLMQGDGIHPNAEAQPAILEHIWPALSPLLQTASRNGEK